MHQKIYYCQQSGPEYDGVEYILVESLEHLKNNMSQPFLFYDNKLSIYCEDQLLAFDFEQVIQKLRLQRIGAQDLLAKALGVKQAKDRILIDVTAGTGTDAIYASLFFDEINCFERNILIYLLFFDALKRSSLTNIRIKQGEVTPSLLQAKHVVYYDPMYPVTKKNKSLPKKSMQILKTICGNDSDQDEFAKKLIQSKACRVIIKRPKQANIFAEKLLTVQFHGKNIRYDVYCK